MRSAVAVITALLVVPGCASPLERAAKEWCLAVRACQMVPVYPPSEDVRLGDVFLVRTPILQQASEYQGRGFLSLDDLRTRLTGLDTKLLYRDDPTQPGKAPRVAFPTFTFATRRGAGLNLAFPVEGVPVALGLMETKRAIGTVSITDATTYAADPDDLLDRLRVWAARAETKASLDAARKSAGGTVYLRVVKRVYLAGAVSVGLVNQDASSGRGRGGTTDAVEALKNDVDRQGELLGKLAKLAEAGQVGGSVTFQYASDLAVGLQQKFPAPLVIGYLGMDVPVFEDGELGFPLPTFERLALRPVAFQPPQRMNQLSGQQRELSDLLERLRELATDTPDRALAIVTKTLDGLTDRSFDALRARGKSVPASGPGRERALRRLVEDFIVQVNFHTAGEGSHGDRHALAIKLLSEATS